ncbi:MAG TPA: Mur ligase domain-containing protein [Candidatus Saccharimonadales bacterium]|jgi:UDP-N-acetylmuramate--alanine ligase|nr:Mur ligase domain-containing protein [Candidatus Saccharimonadales bacterium]
MHIYFSGIGGTAIGPLAMIARQAGFEVSGSDKQDSQYLHYLHKHGIRNIHIGQSREQIASVHEAMPIDWFVYSSALPLENPDAPELLYCSEQGIKTSKRDELLNLILQEKGLKLVAVAGTHGKTTTTAMAIWLFKQLGIPVSYSVGAKIPFGDMGQYEPGSEYFVYEADEFDRNFLAFEPHLSLITGVTWDHHEIFPTREDYQEAFKEFLAQSQHSFIWQEDADYLSLEPGPLLSVLDSGARQIKNIRLLGQYNRLDAWLVAQAVHYITRKPLDELTTLLGEFPGLSRRMEQLAPDLYSDYAHTPEKIRGAMSVASEMAADKGQKVVVIYEPLTNRRQHYMLDDYKDCFSGASKVYWLPSYLAREDPKQRIIAPEELISHLDNPDIAVPAELNEALKQTIQAHLNNGDLVIGMAGGGGGSLDEWLRHEFAS